MKKISLYIMAIFYIGAGINHFVHSAMYEKIMPPYIPYHVAMVYISGICEIVFGALLIPVSTRHIGAWLIIALLIAVFPANVQMMLDDWHNHSSNLWVTIVRLPVQGLFIWWAYIFTKRAG